MMYDWERDGATLPVIVRHPGVMSGDPVYRGTRVRANSIFAELAAGSTLGEALQHYPTVRLADAILSLQQAHEALSAAAPTLSDADWEILRRAAGRDDD